ncbi:ribosomal-processing cysteine protease Prp [Alkaliphilus transvaalensis]|uniref:ribosomal-processing cysteine protease Prp n=1 Tax=Alkaliphilus transvaalensis TaxID=114628 RepID=UPI00047CDCD2|nr:ribosomal-processing cysteine protease Prp [Alkaliphilus transvaalensis]
MISILIERNDKKEVSRFEISGHAEAAERGQDIVCAAVSVLSQTIVLALHEITKINITYEINNGFLTCRIPDELTKEEREKTNLLLETMLIGLKNLELGYSEYIALHDKEV